MGHQELDRTSGSAHTSMHPMALSDDQFGAESEAMDLQKYSTVLFRRRWVILATLATVFAVGMLHTLTRRPIYESTAKIVVVTNPNGAASPANDIPLINDLQALTRSRSLDTQAEVITSGTLLDEAFRALSPQLRAKGFGSDSLPGWAFRVSTKKDTDLITVTGRAYDPKAAAGLANSIAQTYFKRDLERNTQATKQARKYAEEQMAVLKKDLAEANTTLSVYKRKTGLVAPEAQLENVASHIAKLQLERDAATAELASTGRQISAMASLVRRQQQDVIQSSTIAGSPQFTAALQKIGELQNQRAEMLQEYTPQSIEIQQLNRQIAAQESGLNRVTQTIVSSQTKARNPIRDEILKQYSAGVAAKAALSARIQALSATLRKRETEFDALPEEERALTERMQKVQLLQEAYQMLSQKYYTLLLSESSMLPNGQLISQAQPAGSAAFPNVRKNIIMFLFLGIMAAVAAAAIIERLDIRVHEPSLVEQISGVPTLTLVPHIPSDAAKIISDAGRNSALLESFRILRNNISFSAIDREIKLIAVTSPGRGEGKSTTSVNLAMAMAMDGKRTLLMDCDLRRPSLHRQLGVPRELGFTTVITEASSFEESVVPTIVENLYLLPAGPTPPNPSEALNSQHSRQIFRQAAEQYDIVIIDCPPCAGLSDVQVISTLVDGILLVTAMNETLQPHLQMSVRTLAQVDAPVIGGVLNKMDIRRQGYYNYYNYYYYGYTYTDDGERVAHRQKSIRKKRAA